MTVLRWLCIGLVSFICFSGQANAARALSGTASPPAAPAPQRPAAPAPAGQVTETRIAAVVNDEVISVADVRSRIRMVMLTSNLADSPARLMTRLEGGPERSTLIAAALRPGPRARRLKVDE